MSCRVVEGFTLIELLIVVAIIAILAAIAVPNFLEAQVRAKVSRAKSDMRTVATAIEQYAVDHNRIPPDADDFAAFNPTDPFWLGMWNQKARYALLTTPIAYITAPPIDPFSILLKVNDPTGMTSLLFPGLPPHPYAYLTAGGYHPYPGQMVHKGRPSSYGLISVGPNGIFNSAWQQDINGTYDPTNGTTSSGDIIRNR
jgi:type II secretion system protein G